MAAELTFFPVSGFLGTTAVNGSELPFNATVVCTPRLPAGFTALISNLDTGGGIGADTALAFPPQPFVSVNGVVTGALLANDPTVLGPALAAAGITQLWYDVNFTQVSLGYQIENFSFPAPTTATPVSLTGPSLTRYAYGGVVPTFSLPAGITAFGVELLGAVNEAAAQVLLGVAAVPGAGMVKSTGSALADATFGRETPSGSVNGSNLTFLLSHTPVSGTEVLAYNGLEQTAGGVEYTIAGATITFVTAPLAGVLLATYWY
jgi:hypothetical protein